MKNTRYTLLDIIRGFTLISMILFHGMWDLVYIFGVDIPWYESPGAVVWQRSICCSFILLSGFCFALGKKHLFRGLQVFLASVLVSAVTLIFMPQDRILFGILCALGSFMIFSAGLNFILKKINPFVGFIFMLSFFLVTYDINNGFLGIGNLNLYEIPQTLYANLFTAYLGFPPRWFFSSDYFGIFPWIFLFWSGYFLHGIFVNFDLLGFLSPFQCKPLEWLGRHSLLIYILHQPIIYGLLYLFF